ncbi:putative bifunctional diguanylate cyclase/phosphodiesterase [Sphingomonas quercus]|uniref:EAL domain-containing protein n=1 Tax=Sphingomonas quercus TaxID=2842451 RepID=A0ABS6BKF2_9SPHN|nr:EAL domain-containing protein [Sphingomonas quercus]MBU3078782.1 EAL domain-containing protein [Sphingomonas quercus]
MIPVAFVFLSVAALAAFGLHHFSTKSDQISIDRQSREAARAIDGSLDELIQTQQGAAVWDDLILKLREPRLDTVWLNENLGEWLWRFFRHDQTYVLNAEDNAIYGMSSGRPIAPGSYATVFPDLRTLVEAVRRQSRPGMLARPDAIVHVGDLLLVQGRPAAVSVMRIVPFTNRVRQTPGREYLLISVRFLDGSFLKGLSEANLIATPRFSRSEQVAADELAMPIRSSSGSPVGFFIWRPELPGSELWRSMIPFGATELAILGLVMVLLAYRVRKLMRREDRIIKKLQAAQVELRASEAQASHLAFHDALTGLPNRALFNNCIEQALGDARKGRPFAVLLLDLDRFKQVNDTLGHLAGDALIQEFARRLNGLVEADETVARLGGDEFAVLAIASANRIEELAGKILDEASRPFEVLGNRVYVGVSVGIAGMPECGLDRTEIMRKADIALYRAKEQEGSCYRLFTTNMDEAVRLRASLEEDLRAALAAGTGLEVYYQPQVAGDGSTIIGLEALARWHHPTRGFITPQLFVPIAEETGLILELGDWVLAEACRAAAHWPTLSIAVNLSPVQFRTLGFVERVRAIVAEAGVDPRQIELEITEGLLINDDQAVLNSLRELRSAGFRIALDDFGTGYSSLSYLRKFEVDKIKIDRSFVQNLGLTLDSSAIITAVVTLGHAMGLSVTAEGVETAEQGAMLSAIGCNELQGYLYSQALPEGEIAQLLSAAELLGEHALPTRSRKMSARR